MKTRIINIEDEIRLSYLDYAMSVIIGRAIPDVRDGLKPVHRRILFAMHELNNAYNRPYKKSARIVGDVIGKYHPHGDAAVYDALVRMAQDFSMRYPLVDGQGNFGSVDGDPPAAMRYTEVRMARLAHEFMQDIDKETVPFQPNYDNSLMEPLVLPTRVPNLLLNGASGIAVGMATNIPPHNLAELCRAIQLYLENPDVPYEELYRLMPGPDFPTGGIIYGLEGIKQAYETGRGTIRIRGRVHVEELRGKKKALIITEIPYMVSKAKILERIAELVREKKIDGITEIRDESDREGMRVVITLRPDASPKVVENRLYKFTPLETTFGVILLAVVNNRPEVLSLKEVFAHFLDFRRTVIVRRTEYDLRKAEQRAHILEGLKKALDFIDEVIAIIRASGSPSEAKGALIERFDFSDAQAQAILDMRLQRLTGLEREKIVDEYREVLKNIEYYRQVLSSPALVNRIIHEELEELVNQYADERRTTIVPQADEIDWDDLIPDQEVVVVLSREGYIKRTPVHVYRSQRRGGRGRRGVTTREEDFVHAILTASTHDVLLVFTNLGRVYWLNVRDVPEASPSSQGRAIVNLLNLQDGEKVATVLPVKEFRPDAYVVLCTKKGIIKKMSLDNFSRPLSTGVRAVILRDGDELIRARLTTGSDKLFLMSRHGKVIVIDESVLRPLGRAAQGVKGMDVSDSYVIGMEVYQGQEAILVVSDRGYGKRTLCSEFRVQGRGGMGVMGIKVTERNGYATGFCLVDPEDEILLITNLGKLIRLKASDISLQGRATQGVKLMELEEDEKIVDLAVVGEVEKDDDNES
ncbi:DNA gyrase subunit A [Thermodesulforhabdus norvegica]|uniref:DNA gyrase subunit A n=1 Tax=Thermodesulforhabdus norvegica TaxID=39841 RepID=A0A1I4SF74_9BACT|nr:DNA gyrase subunit A [Thermodesulforhabdus norvegica]SFM63107.1 DNA gyrase subunit A [Thermodesulforhabdus norvegica]